MADELIVNDSTRLKDEGNEHFKCGEYQKALSSYTKALKLRDSISQNEESVLYKNRAACYLKTTEYEKAIKDCDKALSLCPGDAKSLYRRSQAAEQLGRYDEAYKDALTWRQIEPKNTAVDAHLSRLYTKIQEIAKEQASTSNKVDQMLNFLFGPEPVEPKKRLQAANNLIVLAKENAGCEIMMQKDVLSQIGKLLKAEKNDAMIIALTRVLGELSRRSVPIANKILEKIDLTILINLFNSDNKERVDAALHGCQSLINTLSGMGLKDDKKADPKLREENGESLNAIMTGLTYATNSRVLSAIGREAILEIIVKNIDYTALNWALNLVNCDGLYRILEVGGELQEYKYESSMEITVNTRPTVSVVLMKLYESMTCDKERDLFLEKVDEYVKDKLKGPEIESKVHVTASITAMLQGPIEVGNHCIAQKGVIEMMLAMAGSDDLVQQTVAAEAIIAMASKKDKCTSIINLGLNILKKLYMSQHDGIKVRALVGLCKIGSVGGTDVSIKPFADGSQQKLSAACRRFLVTSSKDYDIRKWAAEGLSYLTLDADIKEELIEDKAALRSLVDLATKGDMSTVFGVATTLTNLTNSYDKQEMMPEMVELAKFAKQHIPVDHPKDAPEFVEKRIKAITEFGITVGLVALSKTQANNSRELISRVFNAICGIKELRGTVVQQGGAKVLIGLALEGSEKGKLAAAQALSRIAITTNPEIAFPGQRCVEVIRPMIQLLNQDCPALQNFEALMGLCNIAGTTPSARTRIMNEGGLWKIETYMYQQEHVMLKRAAMQCMVNLLACDEAVKHHTYDNDRVKYITLISVDEDLETSIAAAGALAILTGSSEKCCEKVFQPKDWIDILRTLLANENRDIQYRGTCIVYNMMVASKEIAQKLVDAEILPVLKLVSLLEIPECAKAKKCAQLSLDVAKEYGLYKEVEEENDDN